MCDLLRWFPVSPSRQPLSAINSFDPTMTELGLQVCALCPLPARTGKKTDLSVNNYAQERLRDRPTSLDGLLSLIPAKIYYGEDTSVCGTHQSNRRYCCEPQNRLSVYNLPIAPRYAMLNAHETSSIGSMAKEKADKARESCKASGKA